MSTLFRWCYVTALLLLPASLASAQVDATITGAVIDADTGEPLPSVNVFIATSMNGTTTDDQGRYRLTSVPLGALRLYVSMIGFEPQAHDLFIREARPYAFDVHLKEAVYEIGEITVMADNTKWKRQLEKFIRLFIGETPNASETKIINPEVLDFSSKSGVFRAQASEPLVIENRALGYRIQYFLKEFVAISKQTQYDGEPLYEEMSAESPAQQTLWVARRDSAFYGSFRHFMLALLNDEVGDLGFEMYSRPLIKSPDGPLPNSNWRFPLIASDILKDGETPGEKILDFKDFVEIVYTLEKEDPAYLRWQNQNRRPKHQVSRLLLEYGPTVVDLKGDVLGPYGVGLYGYLGFERVADALPREYRPGQRRNGQGRLPEEASSR